MNAKNKGWIVIGAGALIAGCGGGDSSSYQPKPEAKPLSIAAKEGLNQNLLPLAVGNQWTYTALFSGSVNGKASVPRTAEETFKITKVDREANQITADMDVTLAGKTIDRQRWRVNDQGIYSIANGLDLLPLPSPQALILFPAQTGRKFAWEGVITTPAGNQGDNKQTNTILGPQDVDTDTGTVTAIAIDTRDQFELPSKGMGASETMCWLQPGVGIVRYRQQVVTGVTVADALLRLKDHSPKKL